MSNQDKPLESNDFWEEEDLESFFKNTEIQADNQVNQHDFEDYWEENADSNLENLADSSNPLAFIDLDQEFADLDAKPKITPNPELDFSLDIDDIDDTQALLSFTEKNDDEAINLNHDLTEDIEIDELLESENNELDLANFDQKLDFDRENLGDINLDSHLSEDLGDLENIFTESQISNNDSLEDLDNWLELEEKPLLGIETEELSLSSPSIAAQPKTSFPVATPRAENDDSDLPLSTASGSRSPKNQTFDQTMRVSVRKLDSLNNMIGELVVKRNRLEEDQDRLRLFLDNLLNHVQSLGETGSRMHDLYEKSLLEGALLASRQHHNSSARKTQSGFLNSNIQVKEEEDELGALEMDRFTGFHLLSQEIIELIVRVREAASDIQFVVDETDKVTRSLRQVTSQLQEGINSSRMVPFGQTADRLPRAIRNISRELNKQAELHIEGKDVLIDKMIVEHLYNPMTHLVNNAITHGIESPEVRVKQGKTVAGQIKIRAFLQGNQTVISVSDDGAGIDPERVKAKAVEKSLLTWAQAQHLSQQDIYDLLFHPGFSTKDKADDFAGRGVGMDVVSTDLKKIRGTISIESEVGKGTTFTIRLPLVLSICKALTCSYNNTRIAFPIDGVENTKEYALSEIQTNSNGVKCIPWRNTLLPFQSLTNLLSYNRQLSRANIYNANPDSDVVSILILNSSDNLLAVQVDEVLGEQEIVIKQIEGPVPKPAGIAGATVLGDGMIMPIGDVLELIEIAQGKRTTEIGLNLWQTESNRLQAQAEQIKAEPLVLVVDDSITVRELLSLSFNKLGYRVEQARDGQEAWDKLRGGLPCDMIFCDIEMPRMNGLELLSNLQKDQNLNLIPVAMLTSRGAEKHRKLATDLGAKAYLTKPYTEKELMDVAQRLIEVSRANQEANSMVVNSKTTGVDQSNLSEKPEKTKSVVLIIDDSVTVRELLSMTFRKAGFQVEQARDGQEAWDKLQAGLDCDIAFCDIEMPRLNGLELLARLQDDQRLSSLPVAMLTSRGAQKMRNIAAKRGAKGYFVKPYVEDALLEAAQRMMAGEILLENINLDNLEPSEN